MKSALYVPKNTARSSLDSAIANVISSHDGSVSGVELVLSKNGYTTTLTPGTLTADRTFTFPDLSGEIALLSYFGGYVSIGTEQTITGSKTFQNLQTFGGGALVSAGSITLTNGSIISTATGTAANVAYSVGGVGTGMYSGAANQLNLAVGGASTLILAATYIEAQQRLRLGSGNAAGPGLAFTSDAGNNSGLYLIGADNIGFSAGGTLRWDYNTTRINSTIPYFAPNGSAAAPAYAFTNYPDTGMFSFGSGTFLNFAVAGVNRIEISSARMDINIPIYFPDGSAPLPALTFTNDNDSGFYRIGANNIGFSANGALRWDYNANRINSTVPVYLPDGSAALPALSFSADGDTGIYRSAADFVAVSCGGVKSMQIEPNFQVFYDNVGIIRAVFRSATTSGDIFNVYATKGSTASYFYYGTTNTYGVVSDRSTKKNIRDVQLNKASQFIKKMSPKRYELISDEKITNNGFVAQDLKQIAEEVGEFGQMITEHDDGLLGVAHNELLTVVVAALRDALERIETLESRGRS